MVGGYCHWNASRNRWTPKSKRVKYPVACSREGSSGYRVMAWKNTHAALSGRRFKAVIVEESSDITVLRIKD